MLKNLTTKRFGNNCRIVLYGELYLDYYESVMFYSTGPGATADERQLLHLWIHNFCRPVGSISQNFLHLLFMNVRHKLECL
jgi:hypothetical protein